MVNHSISFHLYIFFIKNYGQVSISAISILVWFARDKCDVIQNLASLFSFACKLMVFLNCLK